MLARANRILNSAEFRLVMNSGERMTTKNFVFFYKRDETLGASRFGFVVSKAVGGAVARNSIKRKLRGQSRELLKGASASDKFWFVVRCLPGASSISSSQIQSELFGAFRQLEARPSR